MVQDDPQRRVARYRLDRLAEADLRAADDQARSDGSEAEGPGRDPSAPAAADRPGRRSAADDGAPSGPRAPSMAARGAFADELVRQAIARGEFDDLPLRGKPIPGIGGRHDPDWWLKAFIEREQITGVLPEALQLRKDDAALDDVLDREHGPAEVRRALDEFNARVVEARRQLRGGPPVVTPLRDVEVEVTRWRARRQARDEAAAAHVAAQQRAQSAAAAERAAGRWWRRVGRRRHAGGAPSSRPHDDP